MTVIGIDIGYSSVKCEIQGKLYKFSTNISFGTDNSIDFGSDNFYEFENESYYIGENAAAEAFTTTDYKFLYKFAPLIIYYVLKQLNVSGPITINTGLALTDWKEREDFVERIKTINVNNETITFEKINIMPQGAGAFNQFVAYENQGNIPDSIVVLDIGYNTINLLYFVEGEPQRQSCRSYPGHGMSTLIKPLTNYIETEYSMNFSEQEVIKIFLKKKFIHNGTPQENIPEKIEDMINKFINKLINSVLVSEKKYIQTSEVVYICGGGSYYLKDGDNPPNIKFPTDNAEFVNVIGYSL